jgi:hypothetical protein
MLSEMNYPEKSCVIDRLVTHPKLVESALSGTKTQQRRDGLYAYPGESFTLKNVVFTVTAVDRKTLGDMTDDDAKAEGYPNMAAYKDLILRMHDGMQWDTSHQVWVHQFEKTT